MKTYHPEEFVKGQKYRVKGFPEIPELTFVAIQTNNRPGRGGVLKARVEIVFEYLPPDGVTHRTIAWPVVTPIQAEEVS